MWGGAESMLEAGAVPFIVGYVGALTRGSRGRALSRVDCWHLILLLSAMPAAAAAAPPRFPPPQIPHDEAQAELRFTSTLNQAATDEAWGLKSLAVYSTTPPELVVYETNFDTVGDWVFSGATAGVRLAFEMRRRADCKPAAITSSRVEV